MLSIKMAANNHRAPGSEQLPTLGPIFLRQMKSNVEGTMLEREMFEHIPREM